MLILLWGFYRFPSPKTAFFLASLPQTARACIGCMILLTPPQLIKTAKTPRHKGLQGLFVMHEMCMIKSARVGEGVLRAQRFERHFYLMCQRILESFKYGYLS